MYAIVYTLLLMLYIVTTRFLYPNKMAKSEATANYIKEEINKLGKMSATEWRVLLIFLFTAFLWITQSIWNKLFQLKLDDAMIAIIVVIICYTISIKKKIANITNLF